jgi:hypothetical protein
MQTMLATVVDADGDILCENVTIRTHQPVRPDDPSWCGSFRLNRELARPPEADDTIWLRIPTSEELPAVIVGCCLNDVYFHSRCRERAQKQAT